MEYKFDSDILKFIWSVVREPEALPNHIAIQKLTVRIIKKGWAFNSDVEDLIYYHDNRIGSHQFDVIKFSSLFGIHWEPVCFRPKSKSKSATEFDAIRCEDAALLLILMERLGFQTEPYFFIELLLPGIKARNKELLNNAELEIFWYGSTRGKFAPLILKNDQDWRKMKDIDAFKTAAGYKISVRGIKDEPDEIQIKSPKYRRQSNPVDVTCKSCGIEWRKGEPESSAYHRKEHKKRMLYLDPQPSKEMIVEMEKGSEPELVTAKSPVWKHKEMYQRALAFKREFHYDFIQWQSAKGDDDPNLQGYLFVNDSKAIVGACSFRYRKSKNNQNYWALDWAWICPKQRRKGHLSKRWKHFRHLYGDFHVTYPVSDEMKFFLENKGESHLMNVPN